MGRRALRLAVAIAAVGTLASCGRDAGGTRSCDGTPLSSEAIRLPPDFPIPRDAVLTRSSKAGPSQVVEGYFRGDLQSAYEQWKAAFDGAGFAILFDEIERKDSEISYSAPDLDSIGQVALRSNCQADDRTFVHITNRPA